MQTSSLRRPLVGALVLAGLGLGATVVGVAAASDRSAVAVQRTVRAALIRRQPGTLRPGARAKGSQLVGNRVFVNASDGFALAAIGDAQYPAATVDGGRTWRTDGPALHVNAAQGPLVVANIGAVGRGTVFAYGEGNAIDTTGDGGRKWYRALFQGLVMAVVRGTSGHLVAFVDQNASTSTSRGVTLQYVSSDRGRTWRYSTRIGG